MQIIFDSEQERKRFVRHLCNGRHLLDLARARVYSDNLGSAAAIYYRVDTDPAARAFGMLPDDIQQEVRQSSEPPGK